MRMEMFLANRQTSSFSKSLSAGGAPMERKRLSLILILWIITLLPVMSALPQQWEAVGLQGTNITSIVAHPTDNRILYLVGNYKIFKTVDSGATWDTLQTDLLVGIEDVVISQSNLDVLYAIWHPCDPRIFKSTDGGSKWFRIAQEYEFGGCDGLLNAIAVDPDDHRIVYLGQGGFGPGSFWKTEDGGDTWYSTWYGPGVSSIAIDPVQSNILYAGPQWYGGVRKSYDRGESWKDTGYQNGGGIGLIRIDPFHTNCIFAFSFYDLFSFSVDSGANWSDYDMSHFSVSSTFYLDLVFDPIQQGYVYLVVDGKIYKSTDSAKSWNVMNDGLDSTANIQTLAVSPDGSILYGGGNGLYRYTLETAVEQGNRMQVPQSLYCRNYPNPFNSTTTIEYVVPHPGIIRFSVYSLDCRQIFSSHLRNEKGGDNYIKFDCSGLSSGVYLYVIEGGEYSLKGKMTVLK